MVMLDKVEEALARCPHLTLRSSYERLTTALPGDVANHVPLSFSNLQFALLTNCPLWRVSTLRLWFFPETIDAQPVGKTLAKRAAVVCR